MSKTLKEAITKYKVSLSEKTDSKQTRIAMIKKIEKESGEKYDENNLIAWFDHETNNRGKIKKRNENIVFRFSDFVLEDKKNSADYDDSDKGLEKELV